MPDQLPDELIQSPEMEQEDEDEGLSTEAAEYESILHPTDWTVDTILSQLSQTVIDINPSFQRRDAWDLTRKSRFIESLFLGLPVPQIILADDPKRANRFVVLDGKQRLLSLLQFTRTKPYETSDMRLKSLEILTTMEGRTLDEIEALPGYEDKVFGFKNRTIRCVIIRKWKSTDLLYKVFVRLNTGSVMLSPQELRQALYPGNFTKFVDDSSATNEALRKVMGINFADPRMQDAEILLRHLAFVTRFESYKGSLKNFLDKTCEEFNNTWEIEEDRIQGQVEAYSQALDATRTIFGANVARKFSDGQFGKRFNRAVLEIMTYYFRHEAVRVAAIQHHQRVIEGFKELSTNDPDFLKAFETTTKTNAAVHLRFSKWGTKLQEILEISVPGIPSLIEGNLVLPI